jgi:hypothetical protein
MFGHHKATRQKRRNKRAQFEMDVRNKMEKPNKDLESQERINKSAAEAKKLREEGRVAGRARGEELLGRNIQGLDPKERQAMQTEAHKAINRGLQSSSRKLLGDQSSRGIVGKGGVGYYQQRDLEKQAMEARGQSERDIEKLNSDRQMKKLGAMAAFEEGEAAQAQQDRQIAVDEEGINEERKRSRYYEDMAAQQYGQFRRI